MYASVCVGINIYNYSQGYYLYSSIASFLIVGRLLEKMTDSRAWAGKAQGGAVDHCCIANHHKLSM